MVGYKFQRVSVDDVLLDEQNPRTRPVLEMYPGTPTFEQMSLALGAAEQGHDKSGGTTFDRLKTSIIVNKGIIQPILVRKIESNKLKCIEGNTRITIYKQLQGDRQVEGDWKEIPALVFEANMTDKQIDAVRLQLHLVGTREWPPYAKAKYLHFLYQESKMTVDQIVDNCGGNTKDIMDDIAAYRNMEKYYRTYVNQIGEAFDPTRFSGFRESVKPRIQGAIKGAGYSMEDFAKWIHPPSSVREKAKIYPLNTVRSLPKILENEESRKIFLREGAKPAIIYLETRKGSQSSTVKLSEAKLTELAEAFRLALLKMTYEETQNIKSDDSLRNVMQDIGEVVVDEFC